VIKTCQQCGAVNSDPSDVCCFCDAPFGGSVRAHSARRSVAPTEGNLAVEPEWRREVSSRLQDYRARRGGAPPAALQPALPFDSDPLPSVEYSPKSKAAETSSSGAAAATAPAKKQTAPRAQRSERFEISIPKLEIAVPDASVAGPDPSAAQAGAFPAKQFPVASLAERRKAALIDTGLLIFSYGGMLALFTVLGGRIGLNKLDLTVAGATLALFYAQYFALFTVFGGSSPGMMLNGLRVVSFDGSVPTSRQMAWRSVGYLISAGICLLGFVWALWDDDQLCWHDRISHTYITAVQEDVAG
jgi:uncharacterized RDD family membrane protein YckC